MTDDEMMDYARLPEMLDKASNWFAEASQCVQSCRTALARAQEDERLARDHLEGLIARQQELSAAAMGLQLPAAEVRTRLRARRREGTS